MSESVMERVRAGEVDFADFFEADFFAGLGGAVSSVAGCCMGSSLMSARVMGKRA